MEPQHERARHRLLPRGARGVPADEGAGARRQHGVHRLQNSVYAGKNASAYSAAKALEAHLARCIAAEGGELGIRVNTVLPDAILQGSAIWNSSWREERAAAYGIEPDQLEEYYRQRTTLRVNIYPRDIAEGIAFFASARAEKTTGCMLTVDGGVPAAFTR